MSTVATEYVSDEYEYITCIAETVDAVETDSNKDVKEGRVKDGKENDTVKKDIKLLYAGMLLDKGLVRFQIDCCASCNIIPINRLNPDIKLERTNSVLVMYNKRKLRPLGKCKIKIRNPRNHKQYRLEFQVVKADGAVPLLGRRASEAMRLIQVHHENIMTIDSIVTTEKTEKTEQWTM